MTAQVVTSFREGVPPSVTSPNREAVEQPSATEPPGAPGAPATYDDVNDRGLSVGGGGE